MPDISPNQGIELPNATDNANGPLAFDNYNDDVEPRLVQRYLSDADRTVRNPTPSQGEYSYLADRDEYQRYSGGWKSVRGADRTVRAIVTRTTATSVATGNFTIFSAIINWEAAALNDYSTSMWNIANPSRVVMPEPGLYWFTCSASFASNGTGQRALATFGTGTTNISGGTNIKEATSPTGGALTAVTVNGMVYTTTTTAYIEVYGAQNSGSTLNMTNHSLSIARVG